MECKIDNLDVAVSQIIKEYKDTCKEKVNKAVRKTANDLRNNLQSYSPVHTGKYKAGWTTTKTGETLESIEITVHNKAKPGLPHLLEFGHVKCSPRTGKVLGMTPARPHIARHAEHARQQLAEEVEAALK